MADRILTAQKIARAAVAVLENNLVVTRNVYRGHEEDFKENVNGYKIGDTVDVTRPAKFTVRSGAVASAQDVTEGKFQLTVDTQKGVDFNFTSKQLALDINKLTKRVIAPAMTAIVNEIERDVLTMVKQIPNWVGTPGQTIDSFSDLSKGPERLDEFGVASDRRAFLAPSDSWGLINSIGGTSGPLQEEARKAYKKGLLTEVAGTMIYSTQNAYRHTVGAHGGTPLVNGASQDVAYSAAQDSDESNLITDGWTTSTAVLNEGDVFTIAGVNAVNPVTGQDLGFLRQFVVKSAVTSDGSGNATITVSPAIIASGAYKTVSAAPADNAAITVLGTASTTYNQSSIITPDAFSLCMVPMEVPAALKGMGYTARSKNNISVRVLPTYDGVNDISSWRLDVLYGKKVIDAHKGVRVSGTA